MIEFEVIPDSNIVEFTVDGKTTRDDLRELLEACEKIIEEHGRIRMLKWVRNVGAVEPRALWDNLKFGFSNFAKIERIAGVADKEWMVKFGELGGKLIPGEIRMFTPDQIAEARAWLRE